MHVNRSGLRVNLTEYCIIIIIIIIIVLRIINFIINKVYYR